MRSWTAFALLLASACAPDVATRAASSTGEGPVPQSVSPIFNQTERDPTEIYDPPSATTRMTVGHRLDFPSDFQLLLTPSVVQRLTDRTYWIGISVYQSLAYVGDHGVLLIDCAGPLGVDFGQTLIDAVASITPLPITHVVYSHAHTDHVGACMVLQQRNPSLEIIASEATADEIDRYQLPIARPTRVIKNRFSGFNFEGRRFRMVTPVPVAHTTGDTYIVTPDRVLHAVDFVHPGELPFVNTMNNQNLDGYITFLRHLAGERENYDFASWGHLNVGYASDVDLTLDYFRTLYEAWWPTFLANTPDHFVDPTNDNAAVWFRNFYDGMAEGLFYAAAPAFGDVRMIELGRDHALRVQIFMYTSRFNPFTGQPPTLPSFDPIPPRYE